MGFSYSAYGLCCDFCSNAGSKGNVRKIRCSEGWCQSWACCTACKKKKKHLQSSCSLEKGTHLEICRPLMQQYELEQKMEALIIQ